MYKVYEHAYSKCSIEFSFLATRKSKLHFLKTALSAFYDVHASIIGEICGLDFSIERISRKFETTNLILSSNQDGSATLTFSSSETNDFSTVLSHFDDFSEGYYFIYILPEFNFKLDGSRIPLFDHPLENFVLRFSVHSDSTLFDFEFKNESAYNQFLQMIR